MICVINYRPSVISIGRRLTNSALALATFSPIASLQDLKTLQFLTSINVLWKKIYNILALATFSPIASLQHLEKLEFIGRKYTTSRFPFFTYSDVRWRQKFFSVEICPLDGDFTISLPICLSCPLLAIFWPPSLWGVHRTVLRAFTVYL